MFVPKKASRNRIREAEVGRRNRAEITRALSQGQVTRRDLLKWGLFTGGGALAWTHGLNPFVKSAYASIPTGLPRSPLFGVLPFTQPMLRFDVLPSVDKPLLNLTPTPTKEANTTLRPVAAVLGGGNGPVEGRPPGALWAHQRWEAFVAETGIEATQRGARTNTTYEPGVAAHHNSGVGPGGNILPKFHPGLPTQAENTLWTFNGTIPPKLAIARYGYPMLFRHHNRLPEDITQNNGFGRHTISTHEHNGHHGAENDGFTGAWFYPGQFYDYHWPMVLAGHNTINTAATDPKAGGPDGNGGIRKIAGDWRETMSTHWFHDHMFSHTSENVYKGNAAMFNIYSAIDRGNEGINDGVNLRLPSGTAKDYGNLEYDVNLVLADKAWDNEGQMVFDIFDRDGFLGDAVTVNLQYKPYFEVERRKYRFRILNGSVARFYKIALSDGSLMIQIANDGNLLPAPVPLPQLDHLGVAERYDIVIDFSRYPIGTKVAMVNLAEHNDGREVSHDLSLGEALSGGSSDPGVGRFLEFRVVRNPATPDLSQVPPVLIPNPILTDVPVVRERLFEWGRGASQPSTAQTADPGEWGVKFDGGTMLAADYGRITAYTKGAGREVWTLRNGGGGWDHPIHVHFEEGQILERDGSLGNVPPWERGRKDVYRLRPGGEIKITMQFRDWNGMFMQHCHNTVHEDHAMLMRWDIKESGAAVLTPLPSPIPTPQGVRFLDPTVLPNA
jgi:FtsP/CotA-like multicopper oxidase with cupredoxin domain